jgi:hypothetical protein
LVIAGRPLRAARRGAWGRLRRRGNLGRRSFNRDEFASLALAMTAPLVSCPAAGRDAAGLRTGLYAGLDVVRARTAAVRWFAAE